MTNFVDTINQGTMGSAEAISIYTNWTRLKKAEESAFSLIAEEMNGQAVLDIGIGAGRTVATMLDISSDYVGVDYSEGMVEACKKRYPGVDFRHVDARDLSQFPDNSFAVVSFFCEGLCMVDDAGRNAILKEVFRVLKPNGLFIFSTYNRDSALFSSKFVFPGFKPSINPARLIVRSLRFLKSSIISGFNHLRLRRANFHTPEYSIINTLYHDYSTMLYFSSLQDQLAQLSAHGFKPEPIIFGDDGQRVSNPCSDDVLTFLVRA